MKYKRLGQTLLCLVLVFALLVNVSPVRAEASVLGGIVSAEVLSAVGSMLIGLGIGVGASVVAFDALTESAVGKMLADGDILTDGKIDLYSLGDGRYGVKGSLLQSIFDWLHADSGAITDPSAGYMNSTIKAEMDKRLEYEISILGTPLYVLYRGDTEYKNGLLKDMVVSQYPFVIVKDTIVSYDSTGTKVNMYSSSFQDWGTFITRNSYKTLYWGDTSILIYGNENGIHNTVAEGLTAGHIAAKGSVLAAGYPAWYSNSVTIPNPQTGEEETYYPIGSAAVGTPALDRTQEDIWKGTLPIIIIDQTGTGGEPTEPTEPTEPDDGSGTIVPTDSVTPTLLERLFGGVTSKIEDITYTIQEIPELLREFMQDFAEGVDRITETIQTWFHSVLDTIQRILEGEATIAELLAEITLPIRTAIVDALTYLFAPSEGFIAGQVEGLIAKYPTSSNLFALGSRLGDFLLNLGQQPPVVYLNLGAAEGSYLLGSEVAFIDLSWYTRYKPTADAILGGFLWLWFAWRVWLTLPGILGGASGTVGSILRRRGDDH